MAYRKFNDEVLYPEGDFVSVDAQVLSFLKAGALKNPRQRLRLCTHQDVSDKVHEMFIVHTRQAYVRPHKHLKRDESFYLIEGEVDVVFFDDDGRIRKKVEMGDLASGKTFYYRLNEPLYHTLKIKSDVICFFEVTSGPFDPQDTQFPVWAPDGKDEQKVRNFIEGLSL